MRQISQLPPNRHRDFGSTSIRETKVPSSNIIPQDDGSVIIREVLLPDQRRPWKSWAGSTLLQVVVVATLVTAPDLLLNRFSPARHYFTMPLSDAKLFRPYKPKSPKRTEQLKASIPTPPPEPTQPPTDSDDRVAVRLQMPAAATAKRVLRNSPPAFRADDVPVAAAVLPLSISVVDPKLVRPREAVHLGAFGEDPTASSGTSSAAVRSAQFEVAKFSDSGSGSEGARRGLGQVRGAGFGDSSSDITKNRIGSPVPAETTKVQILFEPRPQYTPDAARQKIEGEVQLAVVFCADGHVRVERVVRGLGHGLDESAENAASQIKFRPATESGRAIDTETTVHIRFELAS
jgi:TonB family protein